MPEPGEQQQERTVKLVSIVAVDVVGFSSMSERNQNRTAEKIEALRGRIEATAIAHGGRVFNTAGDGFMLEFSSAGAALEAIQDLLDKRGKGEPKIRVGAHVGDVIVTINNDLLGHGVNIAARLQALAAPGSALVSAEFRSMARTSPTAAFQSKGRQPLENIEQKVQTFEILSARRRLGIMVKRVTWGAGAVAAMAALAFVSPHVLRFVQERVPTEAEASAPTPASPAEVALQSAAIPEALPALQPGQTFSDCVSCPEMVVLPGGLFVMGSPDDEFGRAADEGPTREVSIAPFAASAREITYEQWDACVANAGCNGFAPSDRGQGRGARPALGLSWQDAQAYVEWLNQQTGGPRYRLLTEAEWEYAARGGTRSAYAFGDEVTAQQATYRAQRASETAAHAANGFALYDMHGNAAEWVQDCYAPNYALAPVGGAAVEAESCRSRVYRGGSYLDASARLRSAARRSAAPDARQPALGFRVARDID